VAIKSLSSSATDPKKRKKRGKKKKRRREEKRELCLLAAERKRERGGKRGGCPRSRPFSLSAELDQSTRGKREGKGRRGGNTCVFSDLRKRKGKKSASLVCRPYHKSGRGKGRERRKEGWTARFCHFTGRRKEGKIRSIFSKSVGRKSEGGRGGESLSADTNLYRLVPARGEGGKKGSPRPSCCKKEGRGERAVVPPLLHRI